MTPPPLRAPARSGRIRSVGIFGPFGWGNLGDAAIQEAMLHQLRLRLPDVEVVGISLNPDNTRQIHGIPATAMYPPRVSRSAPALACGAEEATGPHAAALRAKTRLLRLPVAGRLLRLPRACVALGRDAAHEICFLARTMSRLQRLDLLLVSGGGQISDEWGGPWHHPLAMLKWVTCARLARTPVYVVSVGVGPIRRPLTTLLFRLALRMASYRSYRDDESRALATRLGFTAGDPVVPDLAFGLPAPAGLRRPHAPGSTPVVGLSPMAYCHPASGAWPEQNRQRYEAYRDTLAELGSRLLTDGLSVSVFVSQVRNDRYAFDDVVRLLAGREVGAAARQRLVAEPTRDLDQLLAQIAAAHVVVASRLHGVILALALGKPVVALAYDPKVAAVMRQFGQSEYCLDLETATAGRVRERLDALLADREAVVSAIDSTLASHRARLDEQYDGLFGHRLDMGQRVAV